ncbi:DUF421 domain-containing protein [Rossellomorea vietnamensis]|uniref:YetF C-terminal domain-containing protein n=1 Tax=Rossellomorea vietnamensis TaxID=218284 RepID=A0A0P6WI14_9BACI|nr:YetF domain-containing protein [Rossellomorea vietnamensis]KPL60233.1 hypothetical protein AM506_06295 [Rossellomorea vietnamensis]
MDGVLIPIGRTVISFLLLVIVTLAIGKHINSHKNHYSFALSITVGSCIANMGFDTELDFSHILISFLVLVLLFYLLLILSSKNRLLRKWLSGRPTILMEEGKILEENMKKLKFTMDDLKQHLRELGVFDINEVEYALLEVSGVLSIKKKNLFLPLTKADMKMDPSPSASIPIELIMEGKQIANNLTTPYTLQWLESEVNRRGITLNDIYYAVINSNGILFIDSFNDHIPSERTDR